VTPHRRAGEPGGDDDLRMVSWRTLWGGHVSAARLPPILLAVVAVLALLLWLGDLFGLGESVAQALAEDGVRRVVHALLEWTAALLAAFLAVLALSRAAMVPEVTQRDPTVVILAATLPFVALLDAWSARALLGPTLGTGGPEEAEQLLGWTASRFLIALGPLIGAVLAPRRRPVVAKRIVVPLAALGSAALALVALVAGGWLAPPALHRAGALVPRPFELLPLALFVVAGLLFFPRLHRARPTVLGHALVVSTIPQALCQLEAAFAPSGADLDPRMAGLYLLKLLAYATLLCGMVVDYVARQRSEHSMSVEYESAQRELTKQTQELERVDRELVVQASKRRHAERSLRMLEKAVETMSIGVSITDLEGTLLYVNPAGAQMFGYAVDELLGRPADLVGAEAPAARPLEAWADHQPWTHERVVSGRDGRRVPVRLVADAVRDENGSILALVTSCEDITERRRVEQMKHDFLSTVSHELRTPLTSIIASLGLLESSSLVADPAHRRELLEVANRNSHRLLQLINDLLDLQKLTAGKISLEIVPLEVRPTLEEALAGIRAFADELQVELRLVAAATGLRVLADRRRLVQVLLNLLSNAIKFSPTGQTVETGATAGDGRVVLYVADRGPGIPEAFRSRLFEKFSQADASSRRTSGGSGLGLTIAKELVEAMGGSIRFDTEVGIGTTFYVELPAVATAAGS